MGVDRWTLSVVGVLLLGACGDKGTGGPSGGDSGTPTGTAGTGPVFEDFVNVDVPYTATQVDYTGGDWLTQTVGAGCETEQPLDGEVQDFQDEVPVGGAGVEFYFGDDIDAAPDLTIEEVDSEGKFTATVPVCQAIGYQTFTPAEWEETKNTFEVHQVWEFDAEDGQLSETLNSVSVATASIIPAVLGVEWDPATGIIAGTAFDSVEEPITGAQVFIHDGTGKIPPLINIFYFIENFPNANQKYTSADGLWVAVNVPVGTWTAELWVWDGSQHIKLGQTVLNIKADSVNISNIFTGFGDGIRLPDGCLAECG